MHQHAMQLAARSSVVLLAVAAIGVVVPTAARNDGPSYEAGYTAAANPKFVRLALSDRGMSSTAFCDELLQRTLTGARLTGLQPLDFLRGCEHAVHGVME
jgi:hypothetical protein